MSGVSHMLLAGGTPGAVKLTGDSVLDQTASPASAEAGIRVDNDGNVYKTAASIGSTVQSNPASDWVRPTSSVSASFEIRATAVSGTVSAGTMNTWQALTSDRGWSVSQSIVGSKSATILLEIRYNGLVVTSANYTIAAEVVV